MKNKILTTTPISRINKVKSKNKSKLNQLVKHPGTIIGNPDELVHIDWSKNKTK